MINGGLNNDWNLILQKSRVVMVITIDILNLSRVAEPRVINSIYYK